MGGHEVDGGRRHLGRGHHRVTLVLAVLVVGEDDHIPLANVAQGSLHESDAADLFQPPRHVPLAYCSTPNPAALHTSSVSPPPAPSARRRATYLPMTSASTFTRVPADFCPRVVRACVSGTSATEKLSRPRVLTVRLTPSSATEPFSMKNGASSGESETSSTSAPASVRAAFTVHTPSTWPRTRWPPSRSERRSARSRWTCEPVRRVARVVRRSVSGPACTLKVVGVRSTT